MVVDHHILLTLMIAGLVLPGCSPLRSYEALLVLSDIGAANAPSRWKTVTPEPSRTSISYTIAGRQRTGDLYLPGKGIPEAGVVLVPGAVPQGKDDTRLVALALTLARARFAVLTPDLFGFRELRIRPTDAREVADAFTYLANRADLASNGRVGIFGFSYAVGPAVLAALEEDIREQVHFIVGVGGYYDLTRAIRFFTTGWFKENGRWHYLRPNEYSKLVMANALRGYLHDAGDREALDAMLQLKLADSKADISVLAPPLGLEGRAVYELLTNTDPARTPALITALPPEMGADIAALNLANKDLRRLKARLILIHGKNDTFIPYPESLALAQALPPRQARAYVINRILGHVDLRFSHLLSWQFVRRDLPDVWRMHRAVSALLAERTAV